MLAEAASSHHALALEFVRAVKALLDSKDQVVAILLPEGGPFEVVGVDHDNTNWVVMNYLHNSAPGRRLDVTLDFRDENPAEITPGGGFKGQDIDGESYEIVMASHTEIHRFRPKKPRNKRRRRSSR
ncbi:hypothetical protein A3709_18865 [Halioglobus sp. HI00S01]|nr:hypothetical protein A3709_18865 [Halioglobus sp. HI00S01]